MTAAAARAVRSSSGPLARRLRLALFAVGMISIAVAVAVFYTLWSQQTLALRLAELERQVGVVGSGVAVGRVVPASVEDSGQVRARLLKVEAGIIGARLAVADADGAVLFSTAGAAGARRYDVARLTPGANEFAAHTGIQDVEGVGRVAIVAVPVAFSADSRPARYLVGAKAISEIGAADAWVLAAIAAATAAATVVAFGLGAWIARRVTRPLVRLTEGARAVAAGEWGRQVEVEGDDEVSELAKAFNHMSTRVASAHRAQQSFVGDVSHELRTPITSIRGFAGALLDGTIRDEAGRTRAARIIGEEAGRLADLTATLLALADLDAGAVELARGPVDVTTILDALRARFDAPARDRGVALELDEGPGAPLADVERLLQAATVLVDNAVHHAPAGGRVRVRGRAEEGRWHLDVEDSGPGIPPEERERVFERFARLDPSRAKESGGAGLGLAICRRLIELMGGTVEAGASDDLGGAAFRIQLPAA